MAQPGETSRADDVVRAEAAAWLAKLRAPDHADHHEAFEAWYCGDPQHARIYDALLDNWDKMALAAQVPAGVSREYKPRSPMGRRQLAWAAGIMLLALGGLTLSRDLMTGQSDPASATSPYGEIRTVTLSDGSRVTLDTASLVTIDYTTKERRLTLIRGRARFDVAHDAERPFVVAAGAGIVIAHGTLFDVELRGQRMSVSLLRGSIEVGTKAVIEPGARRGRMLRPGQAVSIEASKPIVLQIRMGEATWPSGMASFEDAPLVDVVAAANRYSVLPIRLGDPAIGGLRFTGTVDVRHADAVAEAAAAAFDLTVLKDSHGALTVERRTMPASIE